MEGVTPGNDSCDSFRRKLQKHVMQCGRAQSLRKGKQTMSSTSRNINDSGL